MEHRDKMPALFIGHGSPENAIEENEFSRGWKNVIKRIPRPKAIVCISAHWVTEGTYVTGMDNPKTIHDFYGFPKELYLVEYNAPGSPKIAKDIINSISSTKVKLDTNWGLDHGTWSVLVNMYPKADIPVIQLSLDGNLANKGHFQMGRELNKLREQGMLILGSGNLVHNLMRMDPDGQPATWAAEFDNFVKTKIEKLSYESLIDYQKHKLSAIAHPTNEHYLPILYVLGAAENEKPEFFNEKIYAGTLSMRCVIFS
jgi:4,5-DOPA dioxygenase extradiol